MNSNTIQLRLPDQEVSDLLSLYEPVKMYIEEDRPAKPAASDTERFLREKGAMLSRMEEILQRDPGLSQLSGLASATIYLQHDSVEILNLPWQEVHPFSRSVETRIVRTLDLRPVAADTGSLPRMLVWVSSSAYTGNRLDYEAEVNAILEARENSPVTSAIEIDICPDGSLESLAAHLNSRPYQVLHFSGHGNYRAFEKEAYLLLEDPDTLLEKEVPARQVIDTILQSKFGSELALVVLAACRTSDERPGDDQMGNSLTRQLLAASVPYVSAMSMKVDDAVAARFASSLYQLLFAREEVAEAYHQAKAQFSGTVDSWVPQLFCSCLSGPVFSGMQDAQDTGAQSGNMTIETSGFPASVSREARNLRFIGRRKEYTDATRMLHESGFLHIAGFPGVGKTKLAYELARRHSRTHEVHYLDLSTGSLPPLMVHRPTLFVLDHADRSHNQSGLYQFLTSCRQEKLAKVILISTPKIAEAFTEGSTLWLTHPKQADFQQKLSGFDDEAFTQAAISFCGLNYGFLDAAVQRWLEGEPVSDIFSFGDPSSLWQEIIAKYEVEQRFLSLSMAEQQCLLLLQKHYFEVRQEAIEFQGLIGGNVEETLHSLHRKAMVETFYNPNFESWAWELPPLLRMWISQGLETRTIRDIPFSTVRAGDYYDMVLREYKQRNDLRAGYMCWMENQDIERLKAHGPSLIGDLRANRDYDLCMGAFEEMYQLLQEEVPVEMFLHMGIVYRGKDDFQRAAICYELGRKKSLGTKDYSSYLAFLYNTARLYMDLGQWAEAHEHASRHLSYAQALNQQNDEGLACGLLARIGPEVGKSHEETLENAARAVALLQESGGAEELATALIYQAQVVGASGDLAGMRSQTQHALELASISNNKEIAIQALILLSDYHLRRREYDLHRNYLKKALGACQAIGDKKRETDIIERLIQGYSIDPGSTRKDVVDMLQKLESQAEKSGNLSGQVSMLNTLGTYLINQKAHEEAERVLKKLLGLFPPDDTRLEKLVAHNNLGQVYKYTGKFNQAIAQFEQAYEGFKALQNQWEEENITYNIGELYVHMGQPRKAIPFLRESLRLSRKLGNAHNANQAQLGLDAAQRMEGY